MIRRPLFIAAITALLVGALAAPAFAHVSAKADNPSPGGFSKITFRVPNEEDAADTTELSVQLPEDHPMSSVRVRPKEGWTVNMTTVPLDPPVQVGDDQLTEAVSTVTWTGGSIGPDQFDEFEISVGPLPTDADSLVFKALQTYSDGTVVRWIEEAAEGAAEPEHPAPTVQLVASSGATDAHGAATGDEASDDAAAEGTDGAATGADAAASGSGDDDDSGQTLGIVGIILGGLGLIAGVAALGLRSKPATADAVPTVPAAGTATHDDHDHGGPAH